jgi:hypothetical protein
MRTFLQQSVKAGDRHIAAKDFGSPGWVLRPCAATNGHKDCNDAVAQGGIERPCSGRGRGRLRVQVLPASPSADAAVPALRRTSSLGGTNGRVNTRSRSALTGLLSRRCELVSRRFDFAWSANDGLQSIFRLPLGKRICRNSVGDGLATPTRRANNRTP